MADATGTPAIEQAAVFGASYATYIARTIAQRVDSGRWTAEQAAHAELADLMREGA